MRTKKLLLVSVLVFAMVFGFSGVAFAASAADFDYTEATTDAANDNGILNNNQTGVGVGTNDGSTLSDVIKSDNMKMNDPASTQTTQRTHGEYQNNTNSCASCHQTHTGAGENLLFKDGVFTTCTACHDGTLGFYNVFEPSTAGTFGGTAAGNASMHLATSAVKISAAPGGNTLSVDADNNGIPDDGRGGNWIAEFNCASCHSAHGSYSARLLNYNPNGMGATPTKDGGIGLKGAPVVAIGNIGAEAAKMDATDPTKPVNQFIVVKGTAAEHGITDAKIGATDTVLVVYEWKAGTSTTAATYVKNLTPWLYGYGAYSRPANYWTRFYLTATPDFTKDASGNYTNIADLNDTSVTFDFGHGYAYAASGGLLDGALTADVGRAYVVKMDTYKIGDFGGLAITAVNETAFSAGTLMSGTKTSGMGVALSKYCAACHTDYMNKAGEETGTFSQAYRHNTTSDSYNCLRCHFAHGTDVEIMKDAEGRTIDEIVAGGTMDLTQATDYMLDKNPSSALKRYTNMAVCWGCHTSSHAVDLKNNSYFMIDGADQVPHGLTDNTTLPTAPTTPATYPAP